MDLSKITRGALRMSLIWGIAWVPTDLALMSLSGNFETFWRVGLVNVGLRSFFDGVVAGATFSLVLALIARCKTVRTLTVGRITAAGTFGGAAAVAVAQAIGGVTTPLQVAVTMAFGATIGAVSAATNLALAKRAPELHIDEIKTLPDSDLSSKVTSHRCNLLAP